MLSTYYVPSNNDEQGSSVMNTGSFHSTIATERLSPEGRMCVVRMVTGMAPARLRETEAPTFGVFGDTREFSRRANARFTLLCDEHHLAFHLHFVWNFTLNSDSLYSTMQYTCWHSY